MANTTDVEVVRYVADVSQLESSQRELESTLRRTEKEADKTTKSVKGLTDQEKKLASETSNLNKNLNQTDDSLKKTTKASDDAGKSVSTFGQLASKAAVAVAALFSVQAVISFAKQVFAVTSEFQKLEAVLTNTLGSSSLAQKALADIRNFAAVTPFSVQELTQSYVKLANQGFKPTVAQLRQLGDLASSTGKGFDQLTEAIIDAQTGEFERLKEFGVRAQKEGDKVTFTFKGVKTQTDFTNQSIRDYITSLGDLEGVSGSMAAISQTLEGQVSNLGDSFDRLFNTLGQQGSGAFSGVIQGLNDFVNFLATGLRSQEQILSDNTQKYIDKQAQTIEKANQVQIDALVKNGVKRVDAERQIFDQIAKENADLAELTIQNNTQTQQQITADTERLAELRAQGLFGIEEKKLAQDIQINKKILRVSEANYAAQIFLRDDYTARVKTIDQKAQSDADAAAALAAKNAKALADAEAKAFALQEQQRRAYNDFSISLIENQFDREAATLKEQFFRKIEDSKKNIGLEITTNSEEYKRLNDELIRQLQANEVKRKEFEDAASVARSKAIIDRVNKEIAAQETAGNNNQANELKQVRDNYEAQLAAGVKYAKAKEQLDKDVAAVTFKTRNDTLNNEIELLESESVRYLDGSTEKIEINKKLAEKIIEQDKLAFEERERLRKEDLKKDEEAAQKKAAIQTAAINVVSASFESAIELRQQAQTEEIQAEQEKLDQKTEADKERIDRQVELGYISQKRAAQLKEEVDKEAAKKEQALKLRQFKADQQAAISRALLGVAQGIVNAFATLLFPAALIASAGIAAVGAIQIATIKSQKPPRFKDGVIDLQGKGTGTSDSIDAKLSRGESVMTAKETAQYKPEFEAIRSGTFEKLMQQKYSTQDMSFIPFEKEQSRKQAEYKARSEANKARSEREGMDFSGVESQLYRNRNVGIKNADEIGRAVARHMPNQKVYKP